MYMMKIVYLLPLLFLGLLVQVTPNLAQEISAQRVTDPALNIGSGNVSHNWAGYIATGGAFTSVSGSWIVPQVSANSTSADATWVGIGGVTRYDLIQTGTQAVFDSNGKVSFKAWYEMLPAISRNIPLTISPGDSITASIVQGAANQWKISLNDITTGQSYQTNVTYTSSLSSAEWIEEMPVRGRSFIPLDNFGTLQFSSLSTVKDGTELTPAQANAVSMVMVNNLDQVLAQPSALGSDGAGFTVNRTSSTSTQSVSPFVRIGGRRAGVHNYGHSHGGRRFSGGFDQRFED
jgi:hypothetical protein